MSYSNCCGHNDCRPCVEYIPCFGPAGPVGPTATNQFLSLGASSAAILAVQTPITFSSTLATNGTDIAGLNPIILAPNHSYYVSYNINATSTATPGTLSGVLLLNGASIPSSTASITTTGIGSESVAGQTIIRTVGNTTSTLQLATTASAINIFTLANAGISVIEIL